MKHYIYCYTNRITNRKYVGQTNNILRRKREHKSNSYNKNSAEYNLLFHKKIRQYGEENFDFQILETIDTDNIQEVNELEQYWIDKLDTFVEKNGYNLTLGGDNNEHSRIYDLSIIDKVKKQIKKGISYENIQKEFGISIGYISGINTGMYFYDSKKTYPLFKYYQSQKELEQIIELLLYSELNMKEIAKITNKAYSTIKKINSGNLHYNENLSYPIRKQNTQQKKADIVKQLLLKKASNQKIIDETGVSISTIKRINKGETHYDKNLSYPLR